MAGGVLVPGGGGVMHPKRGESIPGMPEGATELLLFGWPKLTGARRDDFEVDGDMHALVRGLNGACP